MMDDCMRLHVGQVYFIEVANRDDRVLVYPIVILKYD